MNHFWSTNAYDFHSFVLADGTLLSDSRSGSGSSDQSNLLFIPPKHTLLNPKYSLQ